MPVTQTNTYTLQDSHNNDCVAAAGDDGGTPMVAITIAGTTVFASSDDAHTFAAGINFLADNLPAS
jgi:hypothetical protein